MDIPWTPPVKRPVIRRRGTLRAMPSLSPFGRVILDVLRIAPGTVEEIARETKIAPADVDAALAELVNAGRAFEVAPRRFKVL